MKKFIYIILYFLSFTKTFAQVFQNESYYYQFLSNYQLVNPGYLTVDDDKGEILSTYESFFGPQKVFRNIELYGVGKQKDSKMAFGGRVYSAIAERYSSLTFLNASMNYTLVDNRKVKITTGMWAGVNNYVLQANQFYGGSSEWNFDWRFGGYVEQNNLKYGLSLHNLIPSEFVPLQQQITFGEELNLYGAYAFKTSLFSEIEPTFLYSIRRKLDDFVYWGVKYNYDKRYGINVGFRNTNLSQIALSLRYNALKFGLGYHRYFSQIQQDGYQIQLHYFF
ncbi:MAG: type IX secretion system membrane protein PorP/SprF [Cytophagales bacterium]|nr:type IX secretion system membrane protein PorP/SprF [Cytophagales bacterium]